jgi:oligoendopeptidase F
MLPDLPKTFEEFSKLGWAEIEPFFDMLYERPLVAETLDEWLRDWTAVADLVSETLTRYNVATTVDTTDEAAEKRYLRYLDNVITPARAAEQNLKEKLLATGLQPDGFEIPLRNMRQQAALFREANLPLFNEEAKLGTEYSKIIGAQTVQWDDKELTLAQLRPYLESPDRALRERAFRAAMERRLQDRQALNELWIKFFELRKKIADNAGEPDYRAYAWKDKLRFDYTPDDVLRMLDAIEEVVVPVTRRLLEHQRAQMGVEVMRPWDSDWRLTIDPLNRPALTPYKTGAELGDKTTSIFRKVDPKFGEYLDIMQREGLLDLDNRKGKAPGGYCTYYANVKRPFIFMNGVGVHDDVHTMLHEGGHGFHAFESSHFPYYQQVEPPIEFAEVASMGMELLAMPFMTVEQGGFYTQADANRGFADHLLKLLRFWGYMSVVEGFQHWAYTHYQDALDTANCDAKWVELWGRFMPVEDWTGLEPALQSYWHRQLHIFEIPFYYVEYGLAQMGAVQVWRNSLSDYQAAVANYRHALSLGGTRTLPDLFAAAGAKFSLDASTFRDFMPLIEETMVKLEG